MIDKDLFKLLGNKKKYIFYVVALMILSLLANTAITTSICLAIYYLIDQAEALFYIYPILIFFSIIVRYLTSRGISIEESQKLIIKGTLSPIINKLHDESLIKEVNDFFQDRKL